jgi:hypothetical protein
MVQILLITLLIVYLVIAIYKLAGYGSFPEDYNSKDKILMVFLFFVLCLFWPIGFIFREKR